MQNEQVTNLAITNPNRAWVASELDVLIEEWETWREEVAQIKNHPYDPQTQSDVYADGEENLRRHEVLQAKTLTFLNNNIQGHGFIRGFDGYGCDRRDLRLSHRVKHRLHRLVILRSCLKYAIVPEAFWKKKGRELAEKIAGKSIDVAAQVAAEWLRKPPM